MNKKISELAKELDVKPGLILKKVRGLGIAVTGVADEISESDQNKLLESMGLKKRSTSKGVKVTSVDDDGIKRKKVVVRAKTAKIVKQAKSMDKPAVHDVSSEKASSDDSTDKSHKLKVTVIRKHKSDDTPDENIEDTVKTEETSEINENENTESEIKADNVEIDSGDKDNADKDSSDKSEPEPEISKQESVNENIEPEKPEEVVVKPSHEKKEPSKVKGKTEVKSTPHKTDTHRTKKVSTTKQEPKPLGLTGRKIDLTPRKPAPKKEVRDTRFDRPQRPQSNQNFRPRPPVNSDKDTPEEKPITKLSKVPSKRINSKPAGKYVQQEFKPTVKKTKSKSRKYRNDSLVGGGIRNVNEVLSEDFVLNEYYSDDNIRQRRSKRKVENLPKREVLTKVKLPETMTVKTFAETIKKQATDVIGKLMSLDIMAALNDDIDFDTASLVAEEYGITAVLTESKKKEDILFDDNIEDSPESLVERAPVVVVMGHVDHGKTSLLKLAAHG